jgi:hypothetical protein
LAFTQRFTPAADNPGMSGLGHHIVCRLRNGGVIAPTIEARRVVARVVLERLRDQPLLAFGMPDTHLHIEMGDGPVPPAELGRRVEISLHHRLDLKVSFETTFVKTIADQWHLYRCFKYTLTQDEHHGLSCDPFHEASNLPDLLDLRFIGRYTKTNVGQLLPRVHRVQLLHYLGVKALAPVEQDPSLTQNPTRLVEAAAAAVALPNLRGSSRRTRAARRAIVELVDPWMTKTELARLLVVDRKTVYRLRKLAVDSALCTAIRLQLALRRGYRQTEL